jgi:hypothetical protein
MERSRLPTRQDFATRFAIDEQETVEAFLGKTIEKARALFHGNFLWYSDQLSVAAPRVFSFYVVAATNYLRSAASTDDPDSINGFCFMLEHRLKHPELSIPADAVPNIRATIAAILRDFARYDADADTYGDLAGRYRELIERLPA